MNVEIVNKSCKKIERRLKNLFPNSVLNCKFSQTVYIEAVFKELTLVKNNSKALLKSM